jgi:hypothetical protein
LITTLQVVWEGGRVLIVGFLSDRSRLKINWKPRFGGSMLVKGNSVLGTAEIAKNFINLSKT